MKATFVFVPLTLGHRQNTFSSFFGQFAFFFRNFAPTKLITIDGLYMAALLPEFEVGNLLVVGTAKTEPIKQPFLAALLRIILYRLDDAFVGELLEVAHDIADGYVRIIDAGKKMQMVRHQHPCVYVEPL